MKRLLTILLLLPACLQAQLITTYAGNGAYGYTGFGGVANAAEIGYPRGIGVDSHGNLYIACWSGPDDVLKVSISGIISIFAGTATSGYSGDAGPATAAQLYGPTSIACDASGNVYIDDASNGRIRKVSPIGIITTVAGGGSALTDGGLATAASLNYPNGVALDSKGNLYITEQLSNRVRIVSPSGIINTFAGNGTGAYAGDGGPATAAELNNPCRLIIDGKDNVYIDDYGNNKVRKVDTFGVITLFAGNGGAVFGGDGGPATAAQLASPLGLSVDNLGNVYIADWGNNYVRVVNTSGIINTIAGTGVAGYNGDCILATSAELNSPTGVAVDNNGHIFISTFDDNRVRVLASSCALAVNNTPYLNETLDIYPNPATSELTIMASYGINNVAIANFLGQTVYTHENNSQQVQIDVSALPTGLYFVKINDREVQKFIKQ